MKNVLSIQSHVVYGYAGNKAAVLPMQLLGVDVWPLHTVQFSNHTQYKKWQGMVFPQEQIGLLTQGMDEIGVLNECDAVLSGYIGAAEQGQSILAAVRAVKAKNPQALYFCDPVMGHPEKGCIVADGVAEFLARDAVPCADVLAPNLIELQILSGMAVDNFDQAVAAAQHLLTRGPKMVLVKHLSRAGKNSTQFEMLLVSQQQILHISRPLHDFDRQPVGVGDLTSAVFLANLLNGKTEQDAFEHTTNAINDVMTCTQKNQKYELQIVAAREHIVNPVSQYRAQVL
ncbi:MAG: pyridoxal kinase PdxY [Plesiomonas sp.]|uniref:pyridoxal kinase PdxY n=1 Tax=Plesiomonas sp. TaxID=2486279 RepID=UPI003F2CE43A